MSDPGRPRVIDTPEEFDRLVEEYRQQCKANEEPMTFAGMAYHLGFADRRSLYDYEKYEGFSRSSKRARLLIESQYEGRLSGNSPTGAIFALKNHGWSDKPPEEGDEPRDFARRIREDLKAMEEADGISEAA